MKLLHRLFLSAVVSAGCSSCFRPGSSGGKMESPPPRPAPVRADVSIGPNPSELQFSDEEKQRQRARGAELQTALDEAARSGHREFVVSPGHYRFPNAPGSRLLIRKARNLEIDGRDATFWFETGGVDIEDCENVTLRNLVVDADPVPFMQGEVMAIDMAARTVDVDLDPRFQTPAKLPAPAFFHLTYFSPDGERVIPMQWDGVTEWQHLGGNRYRAAKFLNDRLFTKPDPEHPVYPGCRVAFSVKTESWGVRVIGSSRCVLENVKVYSCYAYAFFEKLGDGGHQYRRCLIGRRPGTGRLLANARDGFHSYLVRNGPLIEDCDFSRAMDDLIAVHGFFSMAVDWQPDGRHFTLVTPFEPDVAVGSRLAFFDFLSGRELGQATVAAATPLAPAQVAAERTKCTEHAKAAGLPLRDFTSEGAAFSIVLDAAVSPEGVVGVMSGDIVSKNTVIRRNNLHDVLARGMLLKAHGLRVESNRIERVACSGIAVIPESYYMEGPFARDVRIVGNHVEDCATLCYNDHFFEPFIGAIQVSNWMGKRLFDPPSFFSATPNTGVVIQGNTIVRPASVGIFLANTDGAKIIGNAVDHPLTRIAGLRRFNLAEACLGEPPPETSPLETARRPFYAIFLLACKNVRVGGNTITKPPPQLVGGLGIGPWVEGLHIDPDK